MAFAGLVHAGEDRVHDAEPAFRAPMRPRATPSPARTLPSAFAADSSARTTVVPTAMMRRPFALARPIAAAVLLGDAIGLVEREPQVERGIAGRGYAGGVRQRREADAAPPPAPRVCQSSANPAEGGSNAIGSAAMLRPDVP